MDTSPLGRDSAPVSFRAWFKALKLMIRSAAPDGADRADPRVAESELLLDQDIACGVYGPAKGPARPCVVLHGLTLSGHKDARLVRFARTLAGLGLKVYAPALPALASCCFEAGDLEVIPRVWGRVYAQEKEKPAVIAFSFGAGLALTAACSPANGPGPGPLFLFGPHYWLPDVWDSLKRRYAPAPASDGDWDAFIWLQAVLAFRNRPALGLAPEPAARLEAFLKSYCSTDLGPKRAFYNEALSGMALPGPESMLPGPDLSARLSPRGGLHALASRLMLFHDADDPLVPPSQSQAIIDELQSGTGGQGHKLLVTPLLSHVKARTAFRAGDIFRMTRMLAEVFR